MSQDISERFARLQERLPEVWSNICEEPENERTVVVIPSMSLEPRELSRVKGSVHYEERLLSFLTLLKMPRTHVVFVSAVPIPDDVISYYLQFLPGVPFSHARERLHLIALMDRSDIPLTRKILDRPAVVERIRRAIVNKPLSYMEVYRSSSLERDLALELDLPMLAPSPELLFWGTKSGSRKIFDRLCIPHPPGYEDIYSPEYLASSIVKIKRDMPGISKVIIKLNEGFSDFGNAFYSVEDLDISDPEAAKEKIIEEIAESVMGSGDWESYLEILTSQGAVAEAFIEGPGKTSPTVQIYIQPDKHVVVDSTHEQILSGCYGTGYDGCRMPANYSYSNRLHEYGLRIGAELAEMGVLGPCSLDFIALPDIRSESGYTLIAIEINMRRGGTTHPLQTLRFLTGGSYDILTGNFRMPSSGDAPGDPRFYISLDAIAPPEAKGLAGQDVIDIITNAGLHYNSSLGRGVVFHVIGALSEFGKLGAACIAPSMEEAEELMARTKEVLAREARLLSWIPE